MSLIYCPECGQELSTEAVACPNCGRPNTVRPAAYPRVILADPEPRNDAVPKWVVFPVAILGVIVLFLLVYLFTADSSSDNANLAVKVNAGESRREARTTEPPPVSDPYPASGTSNLPMDSRTVNVPGSQVAPPQPAVGTVFIDAKVATRTGTGVPVRNVKFYLLDKDIETILSDAELEPIEGQTLAASFGMAIADSAKYAEFYRGALRALRDHIKYAGTTDSQGRAQLGSVKPDSYYLFGAARSGNGFAVWNSTVSVVGGDNRVELSPQPVTEMPGTFGE